ncbi:MAG: hypothetical protein Q4E69_01740 [Bacilli bacterium]|nr:hypothetical protein [Bacilli bacterium]
MKRKLGKRNVRLFVLFSFLVLLVSGLFIYGIWTSFTIDKNIYTVVSGSFTYDAENSYVKLESQGTLQQKWDKKYYLSVADKEKSKNKVYSLGNDVVLFNEKDTTLKLYGANFRIDTNGNVTFNDKEVDIVSNTSPLFYKLDDRKYLMVSKQIVTEKKEIDTKDYLVVEIDKSGNALLLNNELNVKTLSTVTLKTTGYEFDVANEKLLIPNSKKTIDLKKVSGSSNQYVEPTKETTTTADTNIASGGGGGGGGGGTTETTTSGSSAATGSAGSSIISSTTTNRLEDLNIIKTARINSVAAYTSYLDVFYTVNDPKNEYISVYLTVEGTDGYENKLILNKDNTRYRIRNLTPNTEYTVSFGYTYASSENSDILLEDTSGSFIIKTSKNQAKITINKISANKIYYTVTLDQSYAYEFANIVAYTNNVPIGRDTINITQALTANGYSSVITCDSAFSNKVLLKLEDCKFDGEDVESDIQTTFIN